MSIQAPFPLVNTFQPLEMIFSIHPGLKPNKYFFKALYSVHLHQQVMRSWHQFAENQKALAERRDAQHRTHERKKSDEKAAYLAGERRQIEALQTAFEGSILFHSVCRLAEKFRCFEGEYDATSRHLNFAI
jgi:hypothetical protein